MAAKLPYLGTLERRLLLNCARLEMNASMASETEAVLREHLAWDTILFYARLHSVASLLHSNLKRIDPAGRVPPDARRRLLQLYHAAGYRNRLFAHENLRLMEAFDKAGIQVIVPKGLSLLEGVYGSLALRPLIDLIFLVPVEKVKAARELFLRMGYVQKTHPPLDGTYRWCCPQLLFETFQGMKIQVLVLWDLMTWPRLHGLTPSLVWQRAQHISVAGKSRLLLSPEDLILYLCLQADNHGYFNRVAQDSMVPADLLFAEWSNNRLIRFTDIYEALQHHKGVIDWDFLSERARITGIDQTVYTSLYLTNELLGPIVVGSTLEKLCPPRRRGLRRWVLEAVAPELQRSSSFKRFIGSRWMRARPYGQIRLGRLLGLVEFAFPNLQALRLRYRIRSGAALVPIYVFHASRALFRSFFTFFALSLARSFDKLRATTAWSR